MEELREKLGTMIAIMQSNRRERLRLYCNWILTSKSLLEGVFNLDNWTILKKGGRLISFIIIHEEECNDQHNCSCKKTVRDPSIKVYYLSELFSEMVSVSHFQLWFSGNWMPEVLADIIDGLAVSSRILELFNIGETENDDLHEIEEEYRVNDDEEFEKEEESPNFQRIRNKFNSLICEYVKRAFTDPTSLPPFLLDVDEGPTMCLSELIAWLEESE